MTTPIIPGVLSGVYGNAGNRTRTKAFEGWRGKSLDVIVDFLDATTWATMKDPWIPTRWTIYPNVSIAVPMLPRSGGTLQEGAAGAYNYHFRQLAALLVAKGAGNAVLRIGWEMNGTWTAWSAVKDPTAYVLYWRQIIEAMYDVPGQRLMFEWAPNLGEGTKGFDPVAAYPGDPYVDLIGVSLYDQDWSKSPAQYVERWNGFVTQPYGLQWQVDFANTHGKRNALPEWGMVQRADGHGGNDDPYFVEQVALWVKAHGYYYESYFDLFDKTTAAELYSVMTGPFPQGRAAYLTWFGATQAS